MELYRYNENGYYTGRHFSAAIDRVATERNGYATYFEYPMTTDVAPVERMGYRARWTGTGWQYEEIPKPQEEPVHEPTEAELKAQRIADAKSFLAETDWVDTKIDELYKLKLTEVFVRYGSMTAEAWSEALTYLAGLQNQYAQTLEERSGARRAINLLEG